MSRSFNHYDPSDDAFDVSDESPEGERTNRMKKRQRIPKICGGVCKNGGACTRAPKHVGQCRDDIRVVTP